MRIVPCVALATLAVACGGGRPVTPRNVLLVTVDTLRADRLGAYGSALGLTPNIDRLAAEADVFTTAYAPAPFTLASVSALMTGRYPGALGIEGNTSILPSDAPTLAAILHARGWHTGAVVSNFIVRRASGLAAGFDDYDDSYPAREARRPVPERIAPDTTDAALRLLDRLSATPAVPFLLWVHFQDPHGPYTPPAALRERYLPAEQRAPDAERRLPVGPDDHGLGAIPRYQLDEGRVEPAWYRAGYDGEVRYVDDYLGRLLDGLAARGLAGSTLVVLAADHGEGLGENDYWFAHGEYLTDPLIHVPLLLRVPGRPPARHPETVSLLDVLPTLEHVLGFPLDAGLPGRDLFAPGTSVVYLAALREATVPRIGLVAGGYKYLVSIEPGGVREALFALGHEEADLRATTPETARAMRAALSTLEERVAASRPPAEQPLAPADRDKLRALGYLGG
jgi:arylsulfatase